MPTPNLRDPWAVQIAALPMSTVPRNTMTAGSAQGLRAGVERAKLIHLDNQRRILDAMDDYLPSPMWVISNKTCLSREAVRQLLNQLKRAGRVMQVCARGPWRKLP